MTDTQERELFKMLESDETRWFARRRLNALSAHGLLAGSYWNPDLHPRGPDGQFIRKWGYIRWLVDGLWHRGRVQNLLPDGKVIVKPDNGDDWVELDHDEVYSLPTPKGHIKNGPDPNGEVVPAAWKKVGQQAGSNPGGFYSTEEPVPITVVDKDGVEDVLYWQKDNGWSTAQPGKNFSYDQPDHFVALYTATNGEKRLVFKPDKDTPVDPALWNTLRTTGSESLIWTTDSGLEAIEAKLALEAGDDVAVGTKFYVKRTKSVHHAANEMLANEFYKLAGVPVPDLYFGDHQTVASKILTSTDPDSEVVPLSAVKDDPEVLRQIRENMAVDAWLANWDVAGMTMDNIMVVDGVPYRIDTGGSLAYRAQGGEKAHLFGSVVGEMGTFLDSQKNPSSSQVFKGVTFGENKAAVTRIAAISPAQIRAMAQATGVSSSIADTLIARRQNLMDAYEVDDPYFVYVPPKLWEVSKKVVPDEMFWNPISNQWQPGIVKESSASLYDKLAMGIKSQHDLGDPELKPVVGDLVTGVKPDNPETVGVFRVVHETPDYGKPVLMSALDPTNETRYVFEKDEVRVLADGEIPESINSLYTQYTVAAVNDQTKTVSLDDVFGLATDVNQHSPKPTLTPRPYAKKAVDDALWEVEPKSFVFHEYADDLSPGTPRRVVYRVKGVTDNSVSLINVMDGQERIVEKATWEGNTEISEWFIPDPYTQDLSLALLRRDRLIDQSDILKVEKIDEPDVIPGISTDANTPFNTTPISEAQLAALGVTETYSTEFGVNKNIVVGKEYEIGDTWNEFLGSLPYENLEDISNGPVEDTFYHQFLGQSIIISTPDPKKKLGYYDGGDYRGVWFVHDVIIEKGLGYQDQPHVTGKMFLRSPLGQEAVISINQPSMGGGGYGEQTIQTVESIDASVPQLSPVFKPNGDIVWNGVVIGSHTKSYYGFQAKILPEFAINGTAHTLQYGKKYELREAVGRHAIPQLTPETALKSAKSKKAKELILGAIPLKTRKDFKNGTWVQAADGWVGQVEPVPPLDLFDRFPSHVKLLGKDGKVRIVHANLLLEMPEEPEITTAALPDPVTPKEADKMTGHAPFFPLKYGDGNDPAVGQKVKAGKGDKQIEGYVTWVTPPGGKQASITPYADVVDADGKKWKKSLSTITLIEGIDEDDPPIPPATGLPTDTKAAVEVIMDFTPQQVADTGLKYSTDDGHTLLQPQWERESWLQGAPPGERKFTKDGYAPRVGMRLRTDETPGEPLVVVEFDDPYKKPNYVKVLNLHTGKVQSRAISRLWVDHQAELEGVEYVKGISMATNDPDVGKSVERLPNGTSIYRAVGNQNVKIGGVWRQQDQYFFIAENGKIQLLNSDKKGAQPLTSGTETFLTNLVQTGRLEKVAVIDETSPNFAAYTDHFDPDPYGSAPSSGATPTAFVVYDPGAVSHEEALSGYFIELTGVAVEGTAPAVGIPKEHLVNVLAKPASAIDITADDYSPEPPPITGKVGAIDKTPKKLPVHSVIAAGLTTKKNKDSTDAGSGVDFGFGDAEFIEDMQIRTLIARDTVSGQEYVEFHFRMVEPKAEATSDKLLSTGKDITYGKWVQKEMKQASQLSVGDTISVRVSSTSEAVKPGNGVSPNARIITEPVLLGTDSKGIPVYRVGIASSDGHTGAMDIQERAMPSIATFDWDSEAVASQSNSVKVSLTGKAQQAGWKELGSMGYDYDGAAGNISITTTGAKLFSPGHIRTGVQESSKGRRIHRDFPDGSHVRMNVVPSSVSGTDSASSSAYGDIRRWNEAGMVTIRVPIEMTPEEMQVAVSRAMEAVGIPPEKQAPASDEHIALFGLGKLYKTHAPGFIHRQSPIQNVDLNDTSVRAVIDRMDKELEPYLGRKIRLDDIEFHVSEDGRLTALLSRDVARAITQRQGNIYYRHSLYTSDAKTVAEILGGPNRGLMGGADRYASGILISAKSTEADMSKGAGNRVYLTARQMESLGDSAFIFSPDAINQSLDIYANSNDGWGKRADTNRFLVTGGNGENMLKGLIDPTQVAFYVSPDATHRDKVIELLKAKGVTHIGSRPVEEVVVLKVPTSMYDDAFRDLGVSSDPAASVPAIKPPPPPGSTLPGMEAPDAAAAGGEGAGGAI